ncbi:autotransporter outer membrane beta-barrel domain-containing protein [Bordetella trematum]|uniref:autotransporter outer membrane beta-barrel domain-containing protein n=1 Tax=Bordetella trematum TaxID=123899 RepID=UPI003D10B22C
MKIKRKHRFLAPAAAALAMLPLAAQALDVREARNKEGRTAFEVRFFGPGDGPYFVLDGETPETSTFTLDAAQQQKIMAGLELWADILALAPDHVPAIINVGTFEDLNAGAYSPPYKVAGQEVESTLLQAAMNGGARDGAFAHAFISVGRLDFDMLDYVPSQLARDPGKVDFSAVIFHELGHALGIANNVEDKTEGVPTPHFGATLNQWSAHLRDDNGNPARPGQAVLCQGCQNADSGDAFDVRQDKGYFTGAHVQEVLAGAMPGLPVRMLSDGELDDDYMSHIELRNSLMSHQAYRNYVNFMEAELAALQDMGLQIDRRNFYGYSVYGDDQVLDNRNPYAGRNADGTAYIAGTYNTATLGLGLHVYGERNRINQQADLLTVGGGAAGVRVDGSGNALTIASGTRVHANGWNGRGVMFSYGKDHTLNVRGDVQALGQDGIALAFDFGNNSMGSADEYRGSYIRQSEDEGALPLLPELEGALLRRVDISGSVAGRQAALYMADNALVGEINLLRGARVYGDIVSHYDQRDEHGRLRLTTLSLGRLADAQGQAIAGADGQFALRHDGDIRGLNNLDLKLAGGYSSLNGEHEVHGVEVASGATLAGNSRYTLNAEGVFRNDGTLSPGNSFGTIAIDGDYVQGAQGSLHMQADASGGHDRLTISGLASWDGSLQLALQPDWYADGWTLHSGTLIQAGQQQGDFREVGATLVSPTLAVSTQPGPGQAHSWSVTRKADAYAQYAGSANARALGQALGRASAAQQQAVQTLYQSLDFSRVDGSDVALALDQLGPGAYGALMAGVIQRDHRVGALLAAQGLYAGTPGLRAPGWRTFVQPFGYHGTQDGQRGLASHRSRETGVLAGLEHNAAGSAWTYGLNLAVSDLDVTSRSPHSGKGSSTALQLGLHTRYQALEDPRWFFSAHARVGRDEGKMKRSVAFADYQGEQDSHWRGSSVNAGLMGAYLLPVAPSVSLGPVAGLDYVYAHRPGVKESGAPASNLALSSLSADSLQSRLGVMAQGRWALRAEQQLQAYLSVTWDHEWLDRYATQGVRLRASPQIAFDQRQAIGERDAMSLKAGMSFHPQDNVAVRASVSTRLFSAGQRDVGADLSVNWRF